MRGLAGVSCGKEIRVLPYQVQHEQVASLFQEMHVVVAPHSVYVPVRWKGGMESCAL
jgi:hypothetical protein